VYTPSIVTHVTVRTQLWRVFFIFPSGLTVIVLARVYCILVGRNKKYESGKLCQECTRVWRQNICKVRGGGKHNVVPSCRKKNGFKVTSPPQCFSARSDAITCAIFAFRSFRPMRPLIRRVPCCCLCPVWTISSAAGTVWTAELELAVCTVPKALLAAKDMAL
jgi:hypothetical protein